MKKIHLNLTGNITHVCMTLTRTACMAEGQLGTQMLPLWSDPLSICSGKPHRAAAEGLHKRGWYYSVTTSPIPGLSEKNLKPIHFPSHRFLKFGPFILPHNIYFPFVVPEFPYFQYKQGEELKWAPLHEASICLSYHFFVLHWSALIFHQYLSLTSWQNSLIKMT